MKDGEFDRSIAMQCPTCGGTDFELDESPDVRCFRCGRVTTKEQLRADNEARIQDAIGDIKADIMKSVKKDLAKAFKKWR